MTQKERVLAALRDQTAGITQVDFLLPDVVDGRAPVTRVAARIEELRNDGHRIIDAGSRDKCTIYRLLEAITPAPADDSEDWGGPAYRSAPRLPVSAVVGEHHCCDRCEFRWHSRRPPGFCPSCKASVLWIASYFTQRGARLHVALLDPAEAAAA